jgi:selenocysteine lyase/cysteine desulfurase
MMHYAQDSLLRSFSADSELFVALPTGSGSTGAIEKAIKMLKELELERGHKAVVFLTPYEHHSNILPWVEFYDTIEVLSSDHFGNLVMKEVEEQLLRSPASDLIVSVSAASNVTSTLTDLRALNAVISKSVVTQSE